MFFHHCRHVGFTVDGLDSTGSGVGVGFGVGAGAGSGAASTGATAATDAAALIRPAPHTPSQDWSSGTAYSLRTSSILAGVRPGSTDFKSAAAPDTCGAAIDVPW